MDYLDKLRFLVRVTDHRSFSAAALEANVRQSTVSRAIASLENEWRVALFLRSTRHVSPTQAGMAAYERAVTIVRAADGLNGEMSGEGADNVGLLRVNTSAAFAQYVLTPLAGEFIAAHPRVTLEFVSSDTMMDLVAAAIDIAFVAGPVKDSSLFIKKIGHFRRILTASPEFLSRQKSQPLIDTLGDTACIVTNVGRDANRWMLRNGSRSVTLDVHGPIMTNAGGIVREAVLRGLGIGLMPGFLVQEDVRSGNLVRVLPDWRGVGIDLHAVWSSNRRPPAKVRLLMEMVARALRRVELEMAL
jgi:DNA-binding transcriptional LysR family regulator